MFFKKQYKFIFLLIPLVFLYRPFLFFGNYNFDESVGSIFLRNMFGGSYSRDKIEIVLSMTSLFGVLIMNILFGDYICRDFFVNSDYIFSRKHNKSKWFLKKSIGLAAYCMLGTMIYVGLYMVGSIMKSNNAIEVSDMTVICAVYVITFEFIYLSTLFINVLALKFGTSIAIVGAYSVFIVSEIITFCLQGMKESLMVKVLHCINPMSNMTISWNYSDWRIYWSIFYFAVLIIIALCVGRKIVTKFEIGIKINEA